MMAVGLMLRARDLAAKLPRFSGVLRSTLFIVGWALLLSLSLSPTLADPPTPPGSPPPNNQAPMVSMYSTYIGEGIWKITGYVIDDQSPVGLMVDVWGPAMGGADVTEVTSPGNRFTYYTTIVGPGEIYAKTRDALGAVSNTASTLVGY